MRIVEFSGSLRKLSLNPKPAKVMALDNMAGEFVRGTRALSAS